MACWIVTAGAKWPPAPDIPKPSPPSRRNGKKNAPGRVGDRADGGGRARAPDSADVSGRGPFRPHGPHPTLLGSSSVTPGRAQWLRARIYLRLRRRQPPAGRFGLEFERENEHRPDGRVFVPG